MRTLAVTLALLTGAASLAAQVLLQPESAVLYSDPPPGNIADTSGSIGWTSTKAVIWLRALPDHSAHAYLVQDETGVIIEPLDDFVVPWGAGHIWQESDFDGAPSWPQDVWLRVVTSDTAFASGDTISGSFERSVRFGFASDLDSRLFVPEPRAWMFAFGIALAGFAAGRRFVRPTVTGLAALASSGVLLHAAELWPGGLLDVPAEKGNAGFTVAYDAPTAWAWITPEGNGGKYGYLVVADYVLAPLISNDSGQGGPPEQIAFFGHSSDIIPGASYRLATSNQDVPPLSPIPNTVSISAAWGIQGGRVMLIPEPGTATLLLIGMVTLLKRG